MEHLKFTRNKNFLLLNSYTRLPIKLEDWEHEYIKEQVGHSYEEDKMTYTRLQEYDTKYGTDYACYYSHFHYLWYYDNNETRWSCNLRNDRQKDLFIKYDRISFDEKNIIDDIEDTDMTKKTSEPIPMKKIRTKYAAYDYQPDFSYNSNWENILIDKIDREKENIFYHK